MIQELVKRYPVLDAVKDQIEEAYKILETCYENGGKLLIAGNGGSAADCEHTADHSSDDQHRKELGDFLHDESSLFFC